MKPFSPVPLLGALILAGSLLPVAPAQNNAHGLRVALPGPPAPTPATPAPIAPPVIWRSSTPALTRATTIELRFPTPMVETWGDSVESDDSNPRNPVSVDPPLRGQWTWRTAESGVFVPLDAPKRGQSYTFSIRGGLGDATGRALAIPQPTLALKAPGLELIQHHPRWYSSRNAPRQPRVILQFNDKVNPARAATGIHFIDKTGRKAPATVRAATYGDLADAAGDYPSFHRQALKAAGVESLDTTPEPALPLPATLVVSPVEPLPAGEEWRLMVVEVRSADGKSGIEASESIPIGTVEPLMVGYSMAENEIGRPKAIALRFNKDLAPNVTASDVLGRVSLQPQPPGYAASYENEWLRITGAFQHETPYTLTIAPGLTAADGLTMPSQHREPYVFKVIQPVVALPGFSVSQLSNGRGMLDVHAVNVKDIKVRVKVADRDSLIYALRAYRHYIFPDQEDVSTEIYDGMARIPFDAMPGQKIFEQSFEATAPIDSQDAFVIDWRQALNGRKAGALFVSVDGPARPEWTGKRRHFGAQAFVQLTDIGLAWKLNADEIFLSLFSQATGKPMGGVAVTAYDSEKNALTHVTTAEDGTARFPRGHASWLLAETAEDMHAIEIDGPGAEGLGMWRFGVPYDWEPAIGLRRHVTVFTERPVYLPGHTVYFKAISRVVDTAGIRKPPPAEAAVLKAYDSKGRLFHQRDVQFSTAGSLDGALELPPGSLGFYRLEIEVPRTVGPAVAGHSNDAQDQEEEDVETEEPEATTLRRARPLTFRTSFLVEEYKPNTFQIAFDNTSFALDEEKASISLQSRYLLGKPLAKAKLNWTASVSTGGFATSAFPDFHFLDSRQPYYWDDDGYHETPEPLENTHLVTAQARTDLSDDGRASLDFIVPQAPFQAVPREVTVTAEVTDLNQQTITERWTRTLHPSAYYLGIRQLEEIAGIGQPLEIALAAARTTGEPWSEPVEARVTVEKVDFISVRVQTVGGGSNVKTEAQRGVVAEGTVSVHPNPEKTQAFSWSPREPGFYYITARSTDSDGRAVESTTSVQVFGGGWASWNERDGIKIDLDPDKTSYLEGETARILVKSPVTGRALVTVERRSVIRHFFTDITSNSQVIELPVEASMAPNVFVSVFIVRGADTSPRQHKSTDYKVGFAELRVVDARSRLAVAVAPGQPSYRPGDKGAATATVTDHAGAPVAGAEVTFWAADDGVLTLRPYTAPDLWSAFHRPQALAVVTGTSLATLLAEDPQELAFTNKGYMIGGGGEGAEGDSERLRRNFQPLAFFQGALTTDAAGRVTVPFTVPDNLTRFRLVGVVAAGDDAFGTAESSFEINKPLMLEPALPRFANVGDEVTVKGIVLNNTEQAFEVEVSLTLDSHATTQQPLVKRVTLESRGTTAVAFPLTFQEAGTATWQWKAASVTPGVALVDVVQTSLQVGYAQPVLGEMHYAVIKAGTDPVNLLANASPELLQGRGELTVTVANSVLLETAGALKYLLNYPYGCLEQTTSSLLPWVALRGLGEEVPWTKRSPEEVRRAIQQGATRLLTMQTTNGGLAYWPGASESLLWASTYGGMGLALARNAGAVVPQERVDKLAVYLSNSLRHTAETSDPGELYQRAFACYVLALLGTPEPAYHEILARQLRILPHPARAMLALAILKSDGDRDQAIKVLEEPIEAPLESWRYSFFHSRLTAPSLLVWTEIDPTHATTAALTERLLKERGSWGHWGSTYTNGWALLALSQLSQASGADLRESSLEIAFADQTTTLSLPAQPASRSVTLPFSGQGSARRLTVSAPPAGMVRVAISISARPQLVPLQPRSQGFAIARSYAKVSPDGSTSAPENLEIGDLVAVTLDVDIPSQYSYLAVDDPLPSILEAINPNFTSQAQTAASAPAANRKLVNAWRSSHEELRHDRALFFANSLWAGSYRINYLTRVVAEGNATAPPAKIEAMYEPERYGLSGTQKLSARSTLEKVAGSK